jgi:hypothetical protein
MIYCCEGYKAKLIKGKDTCGKAQEKPGRASKMFYRNLTG